MGEKEQVNSPASSMPSSNALDSEIEISGLKEKHRFELESLTLATQPFKTLKFFTLATGQYLKCSISYLLTKGSWHLVLSTLLLVLGVLLNTIDGPHEKHVKELLHYFRFGLWWVALGVASSIGLGSGLHTFVLYLGPHIALFTLKAMQCGRVDLKTAPYDTIQLERGPSWLDKDCSDFGPPVFTSSHGLSVPLSSILPQVQLEAVLWGVGTALGELPPYFISRAACISGNKVDGMEALDGSSKEDGFVAKHLKKIKRWFLSQSQHLNFFTILVLASVPNPLFDLAGIMCGQFGIPFWKFFFATLTGKAIIKTHIQTVFIISVCNNQLLEWMENEMIWVLGFIPGLSSILPKVISKLHLVKQKYLTAPAPAIVPVVAEVKSWDLSLSTIWSTIVTLVLINFFIKIVTSTAQCYLEKQQHKELQAVTEGLSSLQHSGGKFSSIS